MKKIFSVFLLFLALTFISQTNYSQRFPYHLYDTRTLAELVELNSSVAKKTEVAGKKNLMISANPFYSAIRLEYAGESRKLSKEKMGLFKIWMESLDIKSSNSDTDIFSMFDKEYLFKECDKQYWIPVQTRTANDFPKDLKKGDKITLYLMMVGGIEDKGKWDFIFLTNSFKIYE
jgi:hypothetical protein